MIEPEWYKHQKQLDAVEHALRENNNTSLKLAKAFFVYSEEKIPQFTWQVRVVNAHSPLNKPEFASLFDTIKLIIKAIDEKPGHFIKPHLLKAKLQKLIIYLLNAPSWPSKKNPIENIHSRFKEFKQSIDSNNHNPQNQQIFKQLVRDLSQAAHNSYIPIDEIALKIATKIQRSIPGGLDLYQRIHKLCELGIERIYFSESTNDKSLMQFCRVFSLHAYIFKSNADNLEALNTLKKHMQRLVTLLIAYDHKHQTTVLRDFFIGLLEQLKIYYTQKINFKFGYQGYSSLLWTLELLVANPEFITYMRAEQCHVKSELLAVLIMQKHTFAPVADFIVFLGDNDLFKSGFDKHLNDFNFDTNQINHFFGNINNKFAEENSKEFKSFYLDFLEKLSEISCLHYLIPYAEEQQNIALLRSNLKKLDFSFMEGTTFPVAYFFGNAAYKAIQYTPDWEAKRTLLMLFSGQRQNPVEEEEFQEIIQRLLVDYHEGYRPFWKEMCVKIGEIAGSGLTSDGTLHSSEKMISDMIEAYHQLKSYALMCLPLKWKESVPNRLHHLALFENQLYIIEKPGLRNLQTDQTIVKPNKYLISEHINTIQKQLNEAVNDKGNRDALALLTESYMSFHQNEKVKEGIENLISLLFQKMRKEDGSISFRARIDILGNFLFALAPLLKKISPLVDKRCMNLGENNVKKSEFADRVTSQCIQEIEELMHWRTTAQLVKISSQLTHIIDRKIDELLYSKTEFIEEFCARNGSKVGQGVLEKVLGKLEMKEQVIKDHAAYLKEKEIPIRFILPNQAIAMELCCHSEFQNKNLLLKMGTGQGKSLVIAIAALNEARKTQNGRVFVFTSYDHLAIRDQEMGANIFKKDQIESLCISSVDDVSRFNSSSKIIYADIEKIEDIIRTIMLKALNNKASPQQIEFLNVIYGNSNEEIRVILDEYDLLLYDLETKEPYVTEIPADLMDVSFAQNWPLLGEQTRNPPQGLGYSKTDPHTGKTFSTVFIYEATRHGHRFNLLPSVMRLSKFIKGAKRVIGLSGTAPESKKDRLKDVLYFEIPSSQDPKVFGTKIQARVDEKLTTDHPTILCLQKKEFPAPWRHEGIPVIAESAIKDYCDAIVKDIAAVRERKQKEDLSYQRPVLLFNDPELVYKTSESGSIKKLWDTLKSAIGNCTQLKGDVNDADLKTIGRSGAVTLASMKYGRGADILVSSDIKEGLHVILTTPVAHAELRDQMIGRTGRMGNEGSYSAITLGPLIDEAISKNDSVEFYEALHEMTKMFVKKLKSEGVAKDNKKWLLFLTRAKNEGGIRKSAAQELLGTHFEEIPDLDKFYL